MRARSPHTPSSHEFSKTSLGVSPWCGSIVAMSTIPNELVDARCVDTTTSTCHLVESISQLSTTSSHFFKLLVKRPRNLTPCAPLLKGSVCRTLFGPHSRPTTFKGDPNFGARRKGTSRTAATSSSLISWPGWTTRTSSCRAALRS